MDGARVFRRVGAEYVRRYHRLDIEIEAPAPSEPALFVVNHGFGAAFDLNVFAFGAAIERLNLDRPVTVLSHQLGWQFGLGPVLEYVGAQPASPESVRRAFAQGHHVAVFPGGDIDGFKSWRDRNRIKFGGRTGFAREAIDNGAPIVPIVTAGAGDSLLVLSSGEGLARAAQLDKLFRLKALPVTLSLPWGLSVGAVGFLPYLPLPTKLRTRVLPALTAASGEHPVAFAARVESAMQRALDELSGAGQAGS